MAEGKMWTQRDRFGNDIYLTRERWRHIIDPDNHPEVELYFDYVRETIRLGRRHQDPYVHMATSTIGLFPTCLTITLTWLSACAFAG